MAIAEAERHTGEEKHPAILWRGAFETLGKLA